MRTSKKLILSILILNLLNACNAAPSTPTSIPVDIEATALSVAKTSIVETQAAMPTETETPVPTATTVPFFLNVTVWAEDARVPIINYHQFAPNTSKKSTDHKIRMEDFVAGLDELNQAGFTLIHLEDWINGDLTVPEGRRPLVFTMDDLFYNNQIRMDENGEPRDDTGLALAWEYAQAHPEFGFKWTLFANLGDKWYAEGDLEGKWKDELAKTIVWCIDNDARVYNHSYTHARFDKSDALGVHWELEQNDLFLRQLLLGAGREDLIPELGNMFAIPFGYWPLGGAYSAMVNYITPEGNTMLGVFDIDWIINGAKFMAPPYSPEFDAMRIPRIAMPPEAVEYLVEHQNEFPTPKSCQVGPLEEARVGDRAYVEEQVQAQITSGACPQGVYILDNFTVDLR